MTPRTAPSMRRAIAAALLGVLAIGGGGRAAQAADDKLACIAASDQAQQLRDQGKLKLAREQMLACARATCPQIIRTDCSGWLAALDTSLPSIVISAQDASKHDLVHVRVTLDGAPLVELLDGRAVPVDPGPHLLRFETEGHRPIEQRVLIREGEKRRAISIQFPVASAPHEPAATTSSPLASPSPKPTRAPIPVAAIVLGGVALAGLGSFAFFGITGKNQLAALHDTCGVTHTCAEADVNATRARLIVADVSLGVSVIAVAVATGLVLTRGSSAPPKAAGVRAVAFPIAGGAAAALGGQF